MRKCAAAGKRYRERFSDAVLSLDPKIYGRKQAAVSLGANYYRGRTQQSALQSLVEADPEVRTASEPAIRCERNVG